MTAQNIRDSSGPNHLDSRNFCTATELPNDLIFALLLLLLLLLKWWFDVHHLICPITELARERGFWSICLATLAAAFVVVKVFFDVINWNWFKEWWALVPAILRQYIDEKLLRVRYTKNINKYVIFRCQQFYKFISRLCEIAASRNVCLFACVCVRCYCLINPVIYFDILLLMIFTCLFCFSFFKIFARSRRQNAIMGNIYKCLFFLYRFLKLKIAGKSVSNHTNNNYDFLYTTKSVCKKQKKQRRRQFFLHSLKICLFVCVYLLIDTRWQTMMITIY